MKGRHIVDKGGVDGDRNEFSKLRMLRNISTSGPRRLVGRRSCVAYLLIG